MTTEYTMSDAGNAAAMSAFGDTPAYSLLHESFKDNPNYVEHFHDGKLHSITVKLSNEVSSLVGRSELVMTTPVVVAAFMEGSGILRSGRPFPAGSHWWTQVRDNLSDGYKKGVDRVISYTVINHEGKKVVDQEFLTSLGADAAWYDLTRGYKGFALDAASHFYHKWGGTMDELHLIELDVNGTKIASYQITTRIRVEFDAAERGGK